MTKYVLFAKVEVKVKILVYIDMPHLFKKIFYYSTVELVKFLFCIISLHIFQTVLLVV